jgi:hypothetical protein
MLQTVSLRTLLAAYREYSRLYMPMKMAHFEQLDLCRCSFGIILYKMFR